ncbi:hypothetical protein HY489_06505 [Candidatus Woesearchaeota archaeon]|nr:hypothetical protein [Candidatus Woesearchaeota archaeon]
MKPVRTIMQGQAKESFENLNKIVGEQITKGMQNSDEIQLLNSIKQKIELVKQNPFYGDNIKKQLIPKNLSVPNLWRVELSQFWRMLYTIRGDNIEIICFILHIIDHPTYDKLFGYKKQ